MARLRVTIRGELGEISAASFVSVLQKSLIVLQDLDRRISEERRGSLRWVVSGLGEGSSYVDLESRPLRGDRDYGEPVLDNFTGGVERIRAEGHTPPNFTQDNVSTIRDIVREMSRDGVRAVDYTFSNRSVDLTPEASANLEQLVGVRYRTRGSIEGRIELVSVRKGARRFNVTHSRSYRSIRCSLPNELEPSVLDAMRDRRRVVVTGLVGYNAKHEPIRVDVAEPIRFLGHEKELPSAREVLGSDPEFTGDLTTEDFIRSLRDA